MRRESKRPYNIKFEAKRPSPTGLELRLARRRVGITQTEAAGLVGVCLRSWQNWEYGDQPMHPILWEAWQVKARRLVRLRRYLEREPRALA